MKYGNKIPRQGLMVSDGRGSNEDRRWNQEEEFKVEFNLNTT